MFVFPFSVYVNLLVIALLFILIYIPFSPLSSYSPFLPDHLPLFTTFSFFYSVLPFSVLRFRLPHSCIFFIYLFCLHIPGGSLHSSVLPFHVPYTSPYPRPLSFLTWGIPCIDPRPAVSVAVSPHDPDQDGENGQSDQFIVLAMTSPQLRTRSVFP